MPRGPLGGPTALGLESLPWMLLLAVLGTSRWKSSLESMMSSPSLFEQRLESSHFFSDSSRVTYSSLPISAY